MIDENEDWDEETESDDEEGLETEPE